MPFLFIVHRLFDGLSGEEIKLAPFQNVTLSQLKNIVTPDLRSSLGNAVCYLHYFESPRSLEYAVGFICGHVALLGLMFRLECTCSMWGPKCDTFTITM